MGNTNNAAHERFEELQPFSDANTTKLGDICWRLLIIQRLEIWMRNGDARPMGWPLNFVMIDRQIFSQTVIADAFSWLENGGGIFLSDEEKRLLWLAVRRVLPTYVRDATQAHA